MSRQEFLKSFAVSGQALEFIEEVLQPELDKIKDVTNDEDNVYKDATGEAKYLGKKIAATMIQNIITDIKHWKSTTDVKRKDKKDNFN